MNNKTYAREWFEFAKSKFISLMIKEPLDYTEWQKFLWEEKSIEQVSDEAMKYRKNNEKPSS